MATAVNIKTISSNDALCPADCALARQVTTASTPTTASATSRVIAISVPIVRIAAIVKVLLRPPQLPHWLLRLPRLLQYRGMIPAGGLVTATVTCHHSAKQVLIVLIARIVPQRPSKVRWDLLPAPMIHAAGQMTMCATCQRIAT